MGSQVDEQPRVLVVGRRTGSGIEDGHANWDEPKQIGDYDVAIFDLYELENRLPDFDHPHFSTEDAISFPDADTIHKHLQAGNDIVVRLPTEQTAETYHDSYGPTPFDLVRWIPVGLSLADETGQNLTSPNSSDSPEASRLEWEYFFDGLEEYGYDKLTGWENAIESITPTTVPHTQYPDPTPSEDDIVRKGTKVDRSTGADSIPIGVHPILLDNLERPVAVRITIAYPKRIGDESIGIPSDGDVILLPPTTELSHSEFVERYLWAKHDFRPGSALPRWLRDYPIVGEERLKTDINDLLNRLEEIEEEVESGRRTRNQLLWGQGDELEEVVRGAFREFGFDVEGEVPSGRDGALHTPDQTFVLEITGQVGGVKQRKIDKLERHMENARSDYDADDLAGLLVYNHRRERPPEERQLNPDNFTEDLRNANQTLLTTVNLYGLLNRFHRDEISKEEVARRLEGGDPIIMTDTEVEGSQMPSSEGLFDTLQKGKERLVNLFGG